LVIVGTKSYFKVLLHTLLRSNIMLHNMKLLPSSITPSIPNYLSVLIGTQILRNLWGFVKNAQPIFNPNLNKLSSELFYTQNGVGNKKIWWFDESVV
jgi:hypothetical protein